MPSKKNLEPMPKKRITESLDIVDEIHRIAHSGALDNTNPEVVDNMASILKELLDVKLTPKQAEEVFPDAGHHRIRNVLYRKILPANLATKLTENTLLVSISIWKRFLG